VVAVLRARLARPAAQRAGPESRVADPARLVEKAEPRPAPVRPVAAIPDGLRPAAERVREVVLHPVVKSVQEVSPPVAEHVPAVALRPAEKLELRPALARPVAATLGEPPPVVERVPEVVLPLVAERALEVLPPLAEAHVQEAARQQAVVRVRAVAPRPVVAAPGEPQREAVLRQAEAVLDEQLPAVVVAQDEQPVAAAQRAVQAWAEEQQPVVSQAARRPASLARRPGPIQHALPRRAAVAQNLRSQSRPWRPAARSQRTGSCQPEANGESFSFRLSFGEILRADSCEHDWRSVGPL
jgi:hypothetical protein